MIVTRKRDHSEEGRSRNEDDTEIRNAGERLMSEKTDVSKQSSSPLAEAASCSQASRKHHFTDSEETSCKRIRQEKKFQSPEISSESESQEDDSQPSASQEEVSRRQSRRSSKRIASKRIMEPRTASSSASECEPDRSEKGNQRQKVKLNTKGKSLKCAHRKKSDKEHRNSKTTLVTLRASQEEEEEEEEDEAGDFEPDDEGQCFAPEEVNKAPVFVPVGLRSPKPVPVQIEETMEELEISANIPDVQVVTDVESLSHVFVQPVIQREENGNTSPAEANIPENPEEDKGTNDGSTEAAMTLLAMGDPTFQLKINIEEGTQMLPAQEDLHVADNLVNCVYSEQSVVCSQHLLSSPASNMDLFPSEDGSNINLEHQSTDTRTGGEECFEKNATDTSNSSVPVVSSIRPTSNRLLMPESDFRVLRSSENIIQNPVNTNVLVEELEQVQDEVTVLRGTAEMQKVELEQVRLVAGDSLDLHDFSAESTQVVKQADITERAEKETRNTCATSGELQALTASLKPEASEMGQELYPSQSSADGLPEHNPTTAERSLYTINLTQNEGGIQDFQQQYTSSTEETSVVNDNHSRCAEEEQTFILTLVEIPAESKEYDDASALLEQTSEPLLPAPILISPVGASGTSVTGVESIGSLRTAVDELAASLDSKMETKQLQSSPGEPIPKLVQTAQKRSAAELEEDDFPPAKKTLSTSTEDDLESTSKDYSTKSTNSPRRAAGNLLEKAGTSVKTDVLTSAFVAVSESLPVGRSQSETLQNSGAASPGNSISRQEEEVVSRLNSERKAEISEPSKPVDVHEYAQLEHSGSIAASSKPPLLRGGRKPLGFLSLICKKSSSESAEDTKGNKGKVQKPRIVTPKRGLKNPTVSGEAGRESCSLPSASTSSRVESENMAADAAVEIPVNKQPEKPSLQANDQEKEEAPTRISEYFFSDIFMEVDDSE
ncbi:BDP1 factor, partial [Nothocercus nigrocapillus]|nr:BDP1 factor [Nothocercus nigrocapillus]